MTQLSFNGKAFGKTMLLFLVLTGGWTYLCVVTDEFTIHDTGLITGIGFLLLFPAAIFFGQGRKRWKSFVVLAAGTIVTLLVGSFILLPAMHMIDDSIVVYAIVNSLFVAVAMNLLLQKVYGIDWPFRTMAATFAFLLVAYAAYNSFSELLQSHLGLHPRLTMFNLFELALIIPLAVGLASKRVRVVK